jgi:hypothetical protein
MSQQFLHLRRQPPAQGACIGELSVKGGFFCYTLERDGEGKGRIPAGQYEIDITYSPAFNRPLPLLLNVPGFESIRIHPGNSVVDTKGCILVGEERGKDEIYHSVLAFDALFAKLREARAQGRISILIEEATSGKVEQDGQGQEQGGSHAQGVLGQGDAQRGEGHA